MRFGVLTYNWASELPFPSALPECRKDKVAERREPSGGEVDIQQNTGRLAHRYNFDWQFAYPCDIRL